MNRGDVKTGPGGGSARRGPRRMFLLLQQAHFPGGKSEAGDEKAHTEYFLEHKGWQGRHGGRRTHWFREAEVEADGDV